MILFVLAILAALAALAMLAIARATQRQLPARTELYQQGRGGLHAPKALAMRAALIPGILAVLLLIWSCTTVVVASIGVPVTFGKVGTPMQPGLHFKGPLTKVETYPIRNSDAIVLGGEHGMVVKTHEQGQLAVHVTMSYRIEPAAAAAIYLKARDQDKLRENIVVPYAQQGVTSAFSKLTNDEASATKVDQLPQLVRDEVAAQLDKQGVQLVTLTIGAPVPSAELQKAIDQKVAASQRRDQATIDQQRATIENQTKINAAQAQATANGIIAASTTQATLCQELIDTIREKGNVGVVMANPCGGSSSNVIVQAPAGQ
jgi:hypothetical protein